MAKQQRESIRESRGVPVLEIDCLARVPGLIDLEHLSAMGALQFFHTVILIKTNNKDKECEVKYKAYGGMIPKNTQRGPVPSGTKTPSVSGVPFR